MYLLMQVLHWDQMYRHCHCFCLVLGRQHNTYQPKQLLKQYVFCIRRLLHKGTWVFCCRQLLQHRTKSVYLGCQVFYRSVSYIDWCNLTDLVLLRRFRNLQQTYLYKNRQARHREHLGVV